MKVTVKFMGAEREPELDFYALGSRDFFFKIRRWDGGVSPLFWGGREKSGS